MLSEAFLMPWTLKFCGLTETKPFIIAWKLWAFCCALVEFCPVPIVFVVLPGAPAALLPVTVDPGVPGTGWAGLVG